MLERNNDTFVQTAERTRSLREANPNINAPTSIYNKDDNEGSIYSTDISVIAPSEQEFDFDDQIVNSKVYRKLLAQAMAKGNLGPPVSVDVEGDLIDFSDEATLKARETQEETTEGAARLLEGLVMSNVDEVTRREPVGFLARLSLFSFFHAERFRKLPMRRKPNYRRKTRRLQPMPNRNRCLGGSSHLRLSQVRHFSTRQHRLQQGRLPIYPPQNSRQNQLRQTRLRQVHLDQPYRSRSNCGRQLA